MSKERIYNQLIAFESGLSPKFLCFPFLVIQNKLSHRNPKTELKLRLSPLLIYFRNRIWTLPIYQWPKTPHQCLQNLIV